MRKKKLGSLVCVAMACGHVLLMGFLFSFFMKKK